jgi:hypothetical protein
MPGAPHAATLGPVQEVDDPLLSSGGGSSG